jgi:single-stranded DNA-binding protein
MKAKATVIGRLTRDVTSIFANDDGTAKRALFTVACNSIYKKNNEKVKTTDFIPCIAWGVHVDLLKEWGLKGRLVVIDGTIETFQKPPNADGSYDPTKTQVRVGTIEFLGFEDNVREKYDAGKTAAPVAQAGAADPQALIAALMNVLQPKPAAQEQPKPEPQAVPGTEALAAALLGVVNQQQATTDTQNQEVPEELSGLV